MYKRQEKNLSAKWVKDDSFVPIKTIPRVEEIELMSISPEEEVLKEKERHDTVSYTHLRK